MNMNKINEISEKMREFVIINHLQISWALVGMFVFASAHSLLAGNFVNAALFLLAAMLAVF